MTDFSAAFSLAPPGVPPKKWARLEAFLGALPPAAASRLFETLEAAGRGEAALPTAAMLGVLRTRLIEAGAPFPPRRKSASRLFFAPFEDFFVARRRGRKRRARIDRAALAPIWAVLSDDPALKGAAAAAAELDVAILRGERDLGALERALFAEAGEGFSRLIADAEADAAFRADLARRLGGDDEGAGAAALLDLAEINLLIPLVPHLREAQRLYPRPFSSLTEEQLFEARRLYADAAAARPDCAAYALLCVAARMDAPWRALRLYYHLAGAADDDLPHARADAGLIVETLLEDLEGLARGLERDADDDPDTEDAPARLSHFAEFAGGMIAEGARAGDGALRRRVEASRDIAAAALARFSEQALAAIRSVHPVRRAGGSTRLVALRPDIDRPLDRLAERAAGAAAAFLAVANALAEKLDRPDAAAGPVEDAASETRRYAGDLVAEIRAAEGPQRVAAKKRMEATLAAAAPLLPEGEIALLKERAAAAAVSA
jgi:hypothetical protein